MTFLIFTLLFSAFAIDQDFNLQIHGQLSKYRISDGDIAYIINPQGYISFETQSGRQSIGLKFNQEIDFHDPLITTSGSHQNEVIILNEMSTDKMHELIQKELGQRYSVSLPFDFQFKGKVIRYKSKSGRKLRWNWGCGITGCGTGGSPLISIENQQLVILQLQLESGQIICLKKEFNESNAEVQSGVCQTY
jgi:hypothetical protein